MKVQKTAAFSDQIRAAVMNCGESQYRVCEETGIDKGAMCHFLAGRRGLSLDSIDKLAAHLGLVVRVEKKKQNKE